MFINPKFNSVFEDHQNALSWFNSLSWNDPLLDTAIFNISSTEKQLEATYFKSKNEFISKSAGLKFKWQK